MRCLVVILFSLIVVGCDSPKIQWTQTTTQISNQKNDTFLAPDFEAKDFRTGKAVRLSDFSGQIVIINFWFPGCPATPLEAPSLAALSESNKDIVVLGVIKSDNELIEIDSFIKKYSWDFPILLSDGSVEKLFDREMVYPTAFLINQDGYIVGKIVNYTDFQSTEMKDVIDNLRNGKLCWYYRYLRRLK